MGGEVEKPKKKRRMAKWTPLKIRELITELDQRKIPGVFGDSGRGVMVSVEDWDRIIDAMGWTAKELDALKKRLSWMFVMSKKRGG